MRFTTLFLAFLPLITSIACSQIPTHTFTDTHWQPCGDGEFVVKDVILTPDSIKPGATAAFNITATVGPTPVTSGKIVMSVRYASLPIWGQTDDLCTKMDCPAGADTDTLVQYVQTFPKITPKGPYVVKLTALADKVAPSPPSDSNLGRKGGGNVVHSLGGRLPTRQLFCVAVSFKVGTGNNNNINIESSTNTAVV